MDRRALFASGAAAALLAATGVSARPSPSRGGRLRMALSGAARSDAFHATGEHGLFMQTAMVGAVFDTLTEVAADGTLRGELTTGWFSDSEARIWTFDVRPDVTFHDGMPFSARDAVTSLMLHAETVLFDMVEIDTISDQRFRVILSKGDPDFPYRLSDPRLVVYPSHDLSAGMVQGVGTGLYKTHRFQPGRQFIGNRVETHYKDGQAGWFDSVELVSLPSDSVRAEALRDHYVDAIDLTHTADLGDAAGITVLPEEHFMTTAVDDCIALPSQIGSRWPMDNLRAAERWWKA